MKVLRVLLMALAIMLTTDLSAQTVYNSNGSSCGKIESNGTVRNRNGSQIGKIESNGTVRNSSGSQIGKIDSDGIFVIAVDRALARSIETEQSVTLVAQASVR